MMLKGQKSSFGVVGAVVFLGLLACLCPSTVWSASVWTFETVTEIQAPSTCAPDVRLTGLGFDLSGAPQPILGWAENLNCAPTNQLSLVPHWGIQSSGVWQLHALPDPNNAPSDLRGIPELTISLSGVPFYVYAGNGDGTTAPTDTSSIFIWQADLGADPDGPGTYTVSPTDLVGGDTACETDPFIAADFTSGGTLSWVRGAACGGPIRFNGDTGLSITPSALISDLDYASGSSAGQITSSTMMTPRTRSSTPTPAVR